VRRRFSIVGSVVLLAALVFLVGMTSVTSAASRKASVTIVHGLPGFTADIYVNGELLLDGFKPTSTAGPLQLDPGSYEVGIREVGASADSPPVLSGTLRLSSGSNISIVAHLTRSGDPVLSVFHNRFERIPAGRSLLYVRNVAAVAPLSVRLDDRLVKEDLREGGEWGIATATGRHMIAFASGAANDVLIPSTDIRLDEGVAQIVYVIGSAKADNLDLMVQAVHGLHSAPSGVLTGDGGLGAEPGFPLWAVALMVAAGATLIVCTRRLLTERTPGQ
jgi:Domain of unknown function (DUF4397)